MHPQNPNPDPPISKFMLATVEVVLPISYYPVLAQFFYPFIQAPIF